jgi:hypothetical protein
LPPHATPRHAPTTATPPPFLTPTSACRLAQIHHAQKTARYAAAAARARLARDRLGQKNEEARRLNEEKERMVSEKKRARDTERAKQLQQQRERWDQQQQLRSGNSSRAAEDQQQRLGKLMHKMVRQEHAIEEVQRQQALQAQIKHERRRLQFEGTRQNVEMLANSRAFGARCLENKHLERQREYDEVRAARRCSIKEAMAEAEEMRLDKQQIQQAFHQVAAQGKPDAELLASLTGSPAPPPPSLPATPPPPGRVPRPHTAAARLGGPPVSEHGANPARPASAQPSPA